MEITICPTTTVLNVIRKFSIQFIYELLFKMFSRFDGVEFKQTESSQRPHIGTFGLGNYRGNAFTTGCSPDAPNFDDFGDDSCSRSSEIFDMTDMTWLNYRNVPDYPFTKEYEGIYYYSTTHTSDAVFIIGGHHTGNIVAEFRDNQWQQIATLKQGRSRHGSITFGGQTVIIGGAYGHEISFTTIAPE